MLPSRKRATPSSNDAPGIKKTRLVNLGASSSFTKSLESSNLSNDKTHHLNLLSNSSIRSHQTHPQTKPGGSRTVRHPKYKPKTKYSSSKNLSGSNPYLPGSSTSSNWTPPYYSASSTNLQSGAHGYREGVSLQHNSCKRKRSQQQYDSNPYHSEEKDCQRFLGKLCNMDSPRAILSQFKEHEFCRILALLSPSSNDLVLLLIQLLLRLSTDMSPFVKSKVNCYYLKLFESEHCSTFFQCISTFVCSMPQEGSQKKRDKFVCILSDIIGLFSQLLNNQPFHASVSLPIDVCCGTVEQLCQQDFLFKDIQERVTLLKMKRNDIRQESYQASYICQTCAEESDLPLEEELQQTLTATLRKNKTEGPFLSVSEYLTIFTNLMREDFIQPLREKLDDIKNKGEFVYEDVHLKCCVSTRSASDGILCRLKFKPISLRINWQTSKRLTYGNLLCLSEDDFNSLFFATIVERNVEDLVEQQELTVNLIGKAAQDASFTSPEKTYKMFESPSYYEAYAPIMKRLISIAKEQTRIPFQDYFVEIKTDVEKPLYLRNQDASLNLHGVVCSCAHKECDHSSVNVNDVQQMRLENVEDLDESQITALCTALTRELALIQGPPGTGKTYIGLKIVQSLLTNKSIWEPASDNAPIMIVCYTNHALDQFLEGLIKIKELALPQDPINSLKIRRLGGRSKSEIMEQYNIKKFVGMACREHGIRLNSQKKLLDNQKRLEALDDLLKGKFQPSKRTLKLYSFILSKEIIHELFIMCGIITTLPNLSGKGLVLAKAQDNPYHDEIEADRQVSFDNEPVVPQQGVYEQESIKSFVQFFSTVYPLTEKRANQLLRAKDEVEAFPHFQLFKYCLYKLREAWQYKAEKIADMNDENKKRLELIRIKCLQEADVIGVTTTGAAKYTSTLMQVKSKICVIEEAAEVLEPHVITALTNHTQHLILIGDHKQLQPSTNSYTVGHEYKLEVSLFERLANNNFPVVTLGIQHRMRPEISCLVSKYIYNGKLDDSSDVYDYDDVKGMQHNMFFIAHQEPETQDEDNTSPSNIYEADFLVNLSIYLLQNGYKPEEITILTPYLGQMFTIRSHTKLTIGIRVSTLDNYQGEENTLILLSMVRSNEKNLMGFTKKENRVCVAMSRAKVGFYCIGNFSMYRKCSKLWRSIIKHLERSNRLGNELPLKCEAHQQITMVASVQDFRNVPEGGCDRTCGTRFPACNHICFRQCHPTERQHNFPCKQPCSKWCDNDLHRCQGACSEECPPCTELIEKKIPSCGHSQQVPCSVSPTDFSCKEECDKILSVCEHPCKLTCGEDCNSKPCRMFVKKTWPCGHEAQKECHVTDLDYSFSCSFPCDATLACSHKCSGTCGKCSQGRLHVPCKKNCERKLICGHICSAKCAKNCPPCNKKCPFKCPHGECGHNCSAPCKPCPYPCEWKCTHHKCTRNCGDSKPHARCNEPCIQKLKCGHNCIGLCGELCPEVCRICDKDSDVFEVHFGPEKDENSRFIMLIDCKHVIEVKSLDKLVDDKQPSVDWLRCPKCTAPIFTTHRYRNRVKDVQTDINLVKVKLYCMLTVEERENYAETIIPITRLQAKDILQKFSYISKQLHRSLTRWMDKLEKIELGEVSDAMLECTCFLVQSVFEALQTIEKLSEALVTDEFLNNKISILNAQTVHFLEWITLCLERQPFTDQMYNDLLSERRRISLLGKFYLCRLRNPAQYCNSKELTITQIVEYECLGNKTKRLTQDSFDNYLAELETVFGSWTIVLPSKRERTMIIKALRSKPGSWFKCENGHIYNIGGCGSAVQTSNCPECSKVIGGQSYNLASGNTLASEFES